LQEAIGRFGGRIILHLGRQGGRWILRDRAGYLDGSHRSALVAQAHGAKSVFGPLQGRQQGARIHQGCSFSSAGLHHSLMHSITSSLESCDKQSGRPQGLPLLYGAYAFLPSTIAPSSATMINRLVTSKG